MLTHSELTGKQKFSFLKDTSKLTVLTMVNHEERSSAMLQELHDYLLEHRLNITIHHVCMRLAVEAHSWLIRDLETQSRMRGLRLLDALGKKGCTISETQHVIQFPDKAAASYRLFVDRLCREAEDSSVILCDLSVLPRALLFTLADVVNEAVLRNPGARRQFKFAYTWANSYFSSGGGGTPIKLTSHGDGLDVQECISPNDNAYFFVIANGQGSDTAQAVSAYKAATKTSPLVIDDFVFLFHKTAPHDFIKKVRANGHVFSERRDGDIRYIFSSLQVGRLLADRTDELCRRLPRISNLTMLFVPLGPKPCQFATYFGMRAMEARLTEIRCRVNYSNIFYYQSEELRTLHSRGADYCSVMELSGRAEP